MYDYTWYEWLAFFYIYCFFGWIFESSYVSLKQRHPVNRGFLRLPMLPLYGTGAVMMLWVSIPVRGNIFLVYLSGVIAATLLEYVTGYVMERLFKVKYWDYSNQKFQLQGYICLSSSIAWGFLTIFMTEIIHRPVAGFVRSLPLPFLWSGTACISVVFAFDVIQSTKEALALGRALETMTKIRAELEDLQVQLALLRADAGDRLEELWDESGLRLAELKNEGELRLAELKSEQRLRLEELLDKYSLKFSKIKDENESRLLKITEEIENRRQYLVHRREEIKKQMNYYRKGLLLGNPSAASRRFDEAFKELRELARSHKARSHKEK